MEELLQQKNYYCKPNSGLKMNCKLISGLIIKNCKLFLGRDNISPPHTVISKPHFPPSNPTAKNAAPKCPSCHCPAPQTG